MAYTDAGTGWGLTPGAASENLSRMAGGGYGSMYGDNNNSPIYEQRMAQIRGNFASRQAQLGEERRRTENDRANTLAQQKYGTQKDQYEKDYLMKQEQYDQSQENWQENWDFNQQKYNDNQYRLNMEEQDKIKGIWDKRAEAGRLAYAKSHSAEPEVPGSRGYRLETGRTGRQIWVDIATGQVVSNAVATGRQSATRR